MLHKFKKENPQHDFSPYFHMPTCRRTFQHQINSHRRWRNLKQNFCNPSHLCREQGKPPLSVVNLWDRYNIEILLVLSCGQLASVWSHIVIACCSYEEQLRQKEANMTTLVKNDIENNIAKVNEEVGNIIHAQRIKNQRTLQVGSWWFMQSMIVGLAYVHI